MAEALEMAQESMEHAHHKAEHEGNLGARKIALLIAALAAALALAEMGEKSAQNAYLTHHISASDGWAFYQAKNIMSAMYGTHADTLASLPNAAADPAIGKLVEASRAEAKRLDDDEKTSGHKQLREKAQEQERERDHMFHRYHLFEIVVGALQIAIVLASVSVVTGVVAMAGAAGILGGGAALFGLLVALGVF